MPTIISSKRMRYRNGKMRGFHNSPIPGRLSVARKVAAISAMHMMPSHAPLRWRRRMLLPKPNSANPPTTMSRNCDQGKNMSQKLSLTPSGRPPYFMSVM